MTTDAIMIEKARKQFLTALDDTQCDTDVLQKIMDALQQTPGVMEAHKVDAVTRAIDVDPVSWNPDYFSRQKVFAARNFSTERLEHLIKVRDVFRQRNEKGFTPTVAASHVRKAPMSSASSDYQPSSNLKKFVEEGDLLTTRTALRLELNDRRLDGAELLAALGWIKDSVSGIFEVFSEGAFARELVADQNKWTEDYYDLQVTYLKTNFSEKRFLHLIDVREHLRYCAVEGFTSTKTKDSGSHSASPAVQVTRANSRQPIPDSASERNTAFNAALLIGGAIAAVVVFLIVLVR